MTPKFHKAFTIQVATANAFLLRVHEIADVYDKAFSSSPWNITYHKGEVLDTIIPHTLKSGFKAFFAVNDEKIIGALWRDLPLVSTFLKEFPELKSTLEMLQIEKKTVQIIYERELFILPSFSGKGIATALRKEFLPDS